LPPLTPLNKLISMEYAQLGDIVFQLLSYREHTEENEYVWAKQETAYPPSLLQHMGTELQKLTLSVLWHREWCDPREEYNRLKELAQRGQPAKLIIASQIIGDYVVEKISARYEQIDAWGKAVQIACDIELSEFKAKEIQTRRIKTKGPAVKRKEPEKIKVTVYNYRRKKLEDKEYAYTEKVG